jgi:urease accessory protein
VPVLIENIVAHDGHLDLGGLEIERLEIQWFEATKPVLRKETSGGTEVAVRFLRQGQRLRQGDVLYLDDEKAIVVDILPCNAIQIKPATMLEMGIACYEIGNKHLPTFIQDDAILLPYEEPIFKWLGSKGFKPEQVVAKLLNLINATVTPHAH